MSEFIEYSLLGLLSGGVIALVALSFGAPCFCILGFLMRWQYTKDWPVSL